MGAPGSANETGDARCAFVTLGPFSGTNESVLEAVKLEFPDLSADRIDARDWIRSRRLLLAANLVAVLTERGPRIFSDRAALWGAFYRTSFFQRAFRRHMAHRLKGVGDHRFTLQTQSLFDASVDGIPHFVYTDHTELVNLRYPGPDPALTQSRRWIGWERRIYDHARLIFTMSTHVSRSLIEQYGVPVDRVRCVRAGSNTVATLNGQPEPDYRSRQIIYVGRDWERKGGPELVAAFRRVREQMPDASLVILGCSPAISDPGVTVRGEMGPEEVAVEYLKAAVFCMPTRVEPFGIVFVEALAHGLPVVASDLGALPDIVQHGRSGYLHRPGDVDGIARSLHALLSDPARCRRMGNAGREHVQAHYTWPRVASEIAQAIRDAL